LSLLGSDQTVAMHEYRVT